MLSDDVNLQTEEEKTVADKIQHIKWKKEVQGDGYPGILMDSRYILEMPDPVAEEEERRLRLREAAGEDNQSEGGSGAKKKRRSNNVKKNRATIETVEDLKKVLNAYRHGFVPEEVHEFVRKCGYSCLGSETDKPGKRSQRKKAANGDSFPSM